MYIVYLYKDIISRSVSVDKKAVVVLIDKQRHKYSIDRKKKILLKSSLISLSSLLFLCVLLTLCLFSIMISRRFIMVMNFLSLSLSFVTHVLLEKDTSLLILTDHTPINYYTRFNPSSIRLDSYRKEKCILFFLFLIE
jgi:hypothetical protein